jgi:hypothetical protein
MFTPGGTHALVVLRSLLERKGAGLEFNFQARKSLTFKVKLTNLQGVKTQNVQT